MGHQRGTEDKATTPISAANSTHGEESIMKKWAFVFVLVSEIATLGYNAGSYMDDDSFRSRLFNGEKL
jgi:hypothetical protein